MQIVVPPARRRARVGRPPARRARRRGAGARDRRSACRPGPRRDVAGPGGDAVAVAARRAACASAATTPSTTSSLDVQRRRARRADRHQRRGQVDADERDRRLRAVDGDASRCSAATSAACPRTAATGSGSAAASRPRGCTRTLTVRETIMVALEARERSWLVPSMTGLPPSPRPERRKRAEAAELIDFLGLGRYADEFVANLSTGTRRIVELGLPARRRRAACCCSTSRPAASRSAETEAFGPLIVRIQRELGAAMLVIEHDMPLIMGISDRVYCLEAGAGDRRGHRRRRSATTRASSRRTSAPTSGRSSARGDRRAAPPSG